MKVKELKEILSKLDDDIEIVVDLVTDEKYADSNIWTSDVRDLFICENNKLLNVKGGKIVQRAHKDTDGARKCLIL